MALKQYFVYDMNRDAQNG